MKSDHFPFEHFALKFQNDYNPDLTSPKKYYALSMFPYPSGNAHFGHIRVYTIGDVISRYMIQSGYEVFQPMGWDACGLPAENAARDMEIDPKTWTYKNIDTIRNTFKKMHFLHHKSSDIPTCNPLYIKLQQELFVHMYNNGFVKEKYDFVNWDPKDQTVLANEQVINGKGWRSGVPVENKLIKQWYFNMSEYAEDLYNDIEDNMNNWTNTTKHAQKKWINKSKGAKTTFTIINPKTSQQSIEVFSTRPETIYGAKFIAISLLHPITMELLKDNKDIEEFQKVISKSYEKIDYSGLFTGMYGNHPLMPDIKLPIFITRYVNNLGTGAVFCVPAHCNNDYEFFKTNLHYFNKNREIITVIESTNSLPNVQHGIMINSHQWNGKESEKINNSILNGDVKYFIPHMQYSLKDWCISRNRYWGIPIPLIHCPKCNVIPEHITRLPILHPPFSNSDNPLEEDDWKNITCYQCNGEARRESATMDTFVDSSWYWLNYLIHLYYDQDTINKSHLIHLLPHQKINEWLPIDIYIGGKEHATMHLIYIRYMSIILKKLGLIDKHVTIDTMIHQGLLHNNSYKTADGKYIPFNKVDHKDGKHYIQGTDEELTAIMEKMSKSKLNGIDPEPIIESVGSDVVKLFVLSNYAIQDNMEWKDEVLQSCWKLVNKIWKIHILINETVCVVHDDQVIQDIQLHFSRIDGHFKDRKFNCCIAEIRITLGKIQEALNNKITRLIDQWNLFLVHVYPIIPVTSFSLLTDNEYEDWKDSIPIGIPVYNIVKKEEDNKISLMIDNVYIMQVNNIEYSMDNIHSLIAEYNINLKGTINKVIYRKDRMVNIVTNKI